MAVNHPLSPGGATPVLLDTNALLPSRLSDVLDKHVAAAALVLRDLALQDNPDDKVFIVSSNVKHLAVADMKRLGILVIAPGKFIDSLTRADAARVGSALDRCVKSLKNPLYPRARLLESLQLHGARATARHFVSAWGIKLPPL